MVKVQKDLKGWKMWEHGTLDSRLTVLERAEDYIDSQGKKWARWLCECSCQDKNKIIVWHRSLCDGRTLSCGCLQKERAVKVNREVNPVDLSGEYGIGWTLNTGAEFYFDLEDYDKIKDMCWYETKQRSASQLMAHIPGKRRPVRMHVWLGFKNHDHIDRNELNNRKSNLRPATVKENARNGPLRSTNTSGIIGVGWRERYQKWQAQITVDYKGIHLGYFTNKDDAIRARLNAEVKYFGEFAPQQHLYEQYGITPQNDCINQTNTDKSECLKLGKNYDLIRTHIRCIILIQTTIHSTEMGDFNAGIYEKI